MNEDFELTIGLKMHLMIKKLKYLMQACSNLSAIVKIAELFAKLHIIEGTNHDGKRTQ